LSVIFSDKMSKLSVLSVSVSCCVPSCGTEKENSHTRGYGQALLLV